ncbi:hypothetical protein O6H91_07G070700 [Diphasiastrum complanatum]|uniref:Uncharacterized protein n=1 Tax=Diphasiastrum complanatum TaxID=34168 RepID=A0ACC2D6M6_DIPCM|nr:hypothetical protein O6H91_Y004500 [Diphasiastrum complanatum]KAJ7549819.1 hypothetical protein O6H91_07G070700 [Diphasiastrum complanatum]
MKMRQALAMEAFSVHSTALLIMIMISVSTVTQSVVRCDDMQNPLPPIVPGLAYGFYSKSCPAAEFTVSQSMQSFLSCNISQAAGVVRLLFHDCFVQGCDGSVLINDTAGEQIAIPNLTLRRSAFNVIELIKARLESSCPGTVSCADILALAARDAVFLAGGPFIPMPTGRRDSLNFADKATVESNLPAPFFNSSQLIASFSSKGLNETDLVALSGGHTFGIAHCSSFNNRLEPTIDPTLNPSFAQSLLQICPNSSVNAPTNLDILTPNTFDNKYFTDIQAGEVLFNSDATLLGDARTKDYVTNFSSDQTQFFEQFFFSFTKMSMISVLTGSEGNIRNVCSVLNTGNESASQGIAQQMQTDMSAST